MLMPLLIASIASCKTCPPVSKPVPPPPRIVIAESIVCDLPPLPAPLAKPVGFPSPDGQSIYVSLTDFTLLASYILGLHQWVEAASGCIKGAP
jgi:hypothetical protein